MTRDEFVAQRSPCWRELEELLDAPRAADNGERIAHIAALYRELCADTMRARSLGFGPDLRRRLDALAARSHNFLYRTPRQHAMSAVRRMLSDFPRTVREQWPFVLTAAVLFWLPFAVGLIGALHSQAFAERVLSAEALEQAAESYSRGFAAGRSSGTNATMAGFYVSNNIGIAFRCFATGVLFGAGSVFFLVYNGLNTGTVVGYVHFVGHGRNIFTFVCGHSAFELGAIVICGAAGLKLGYSLLDTGGLTRLASLRVSGKSTVTLVLGAAMLLTLAAALEAFWSPSSAPDQLKWVVGAANWVFLFAFLAFAGEPRSAGEAA